MSILESGSRTAFVLPGAASPLDDGRVSAALEEYLSRRFVPRRGGRAEFLAQHAEIAVELDECLDGLDLVQSAVGQLGLPDEALMARTRLGDYEILREVGRGGMGVVYEAEQLSLGRRVALKVLATTASLDPRQRQRFQVEAQAAALLQHENIVPVFGFGCDLGVHYYAMQFIEGCSLAEIIGGLRIGVTRQPEDDASERGTTAQSGRKALAGLFPALADVRGNPAACPSSHDRQHWRIVAGLGRQAALALDHSHGIGVFHRDIKPSNLLLDLAGHLWVADFGLARIAHDDHGLTRTGDLVGTLRYMSPEQIRGGPAGVNPPRADIYALGATLYELLTLRPAFDATDRQELSQRVLHEEPVPPRRIDPTIPRDLETIVLKAMAKEPGSRYGTARELAEDLERFLHDLPIQARRPGPVERVAKWARRHRPAVVTTALLLLVSLTIVAGSLWEAKRRTEAALLSVTVAKGKLEAALKSESQQAWRGRMTFETSQSVIDQVTRLFAAKRASGDYTVTDQEIDQVCRYMLAYDDRVVHLFADGDRPTEVVAHASRSSGALRMLLRDSRGHDDYRRAIRTYEALVAKYPGFLWLRTALIETQTEFAHHLEAIGDSAAADVAIHGALEVAEGLLSDSRADSACFNMALKGAFNNLASRLVDGPPSRPDDPARAASVARKAISWAPDEPAFWATLAAAHLRNGQWSAAASALKTAICLGTGRRPIQRLAVPWSAIARATRPDRGPEPSRRPTD